MHLSVGNHVRMGQQMKLAPRMIQSMEILQMPQAQLEERIELELASNPTLELQEPGADAEGLRDAMAQERRDDREHTRELVVGGADGAPGAGESAADFERLDNLSEQYGDAWSNTLESGEGRLSDRSERFLSGPGPSSYAGERDGKMDAMANSPAKMASLYEQLMGQWRMAQADDNLDERLFDLGEYLIGNIDADGYLRADPEQLRDAAPAKLGDVSAEEVDEAIEILQMALDPAGIAARSLAECILLQIDAKRRDPDADRDLLDLQEVLIRDHLKDIEINRFPRMVEATGRGLGELKHAVARLRAYSPHPGRNLADPVTRTITPDAVITYDELTDTYTALLTSGRLPALQISADYEDLAKDKTQEKAARDFVGRQLRSARWLLDAIRQRQHTLLRVIGVVINAQRGWFEQGDAGLVPLPMTLVADQLGIHVATVSRAVSEKYLQTPRGIVPLRMFFSGGTQSAGGDDVSWTAVQAKLKEVIDDEDKTEPLSDDELVEALGERGITIARRTVAKYRGQLGIGTKRQRREFV
ncbi:RNA polymerase factor sigma-54 [Phycisphaera mikurensis]|uniref:RNA polymerase sigma-54 factor n=1 Tax=Phycisphaera mikurensis (strain NBRC 102666 / KCTC 22515 / FYK2301M01) TaxID=1142394 RepID=I0ID50_PHYMF|nr:RNA polymerase factor sigma-54 [Phycisphaera mikurensis]MBB6442312.1 RNA polymerase sigma-54 factor [Phycisphaera mikurensis]BAM03188.1 RNA polymerase sigma-54 factor [Phycisphaera mikurensis NBRC 102666]